MKLVHNALYHKTQIKFELWWRHFNHSRVIELCPFRKGKITKYLVSVLYLKFASTKCYETYTQCLLSQNTDQVQILVVSL